MALKFYKSVLAGLEVVTGEPDTAKGEVAPQTVRFTPYREKEFGDVTKVGYLKTDDARAIEILAGDPNVVAISSEDYDKATGKGSVQLPY